MLFVEYNYISTPSLKSLISLFYLGCFPTAVAFLIRFNLIINAGPVFLSYVSYLIPGFAIIWGFIFLNELISFMSFIGLFFILFGIYLSQKFSNVKSNYKMNKK